MFVNAANKDVTVGRFRVPNASTAGMILQCYQENSQNDIAMQPRKRPKGETGSLGNTLLASSQNSVLRTMWCESLKCATKRAHTSDKAYSNIK